MTRKWGLIVFSCVLFKGELAVCLDRAFLFLTGFCLIVILKTTDRGICAGEHRCGKNTALRTRFYGKGYMK